MQGTNSPVTRKADESMNFDQQMADLTQELEQLQKITDDNMLKLITKRQTYPKIIRDLFELSKTARSERLTDGPLDLPPVDDVPVEKYKADINRIVDERVDLTERALELEQELEKVQLLSEKQTLYREFMFEALHNDSSMPLIMPLNF